MTIVKLIVFTFLIPFNFLSKSKFIWGEESSKTVSDYLFNFDKMQTKEVGKNYM